LLFLECVPERQHSWGYLSGNKGDSWCHFPPLLLSVNRTTCRKQFQHWLPNLLTPSPNPCTPVELLFSGTLASVPACWAPLPEDQYKPLPTPRLPIREFYRALVLVEVVTGLISQAHQSTPNLKVATFQPGTKHCPQQVGRASADDWPKG